MHIKGYLTKDKNSGSVCLWLSKPKRSQFGDYYCGYGVTPIESEEFNDVTWDGGVQEVTLNIERNDIKKDDDY